MNLIEKLKGVFRKMFSRQTIQDVLKIQPAISNEMKDSIELWKDMYLDKAPWLADEDVRSLGLPSTIASEKANLATLEMEVKVTGETEKAKFIKGLLPEFVKDLRINLEHGIALGSFIVKPYPVKLADGKYTIKFDYVKACNFYPLAFSQDNQLSEVAFVDRIVDKDIIYNKLEYHRLQDHTVTVINKAFKATNRNSGVYSASSDSERELGTEIPLTEVEAWKDIEPVVTIENMDTQLFAYFRMPIANNVDLNSSMGVSGYSRAVDLIKDADEQYSNLIWEFTGGQLAVDVDRTAFNYYKNEKGEDKPVLPKLQQRLYRKNLDLGDENFYNVFSPPLRDASILNGLNSILMRIEDACALSRGTLSNETFAEARTATELKILKQRTFAANKDIQDELQKLITSLIHIIDKYCILYNIVPDEEYEISFSWDDSILVDKDAERQMDLLNVDKGLMSRVEFRMKWMGETEDQATEAIRKIDEDALAKQQAQMELQSKYAQNTETKPNSNKNGGTPNDAEATQKKLNRANESTEKTGK